MVKVDKDKKLLKLNENGMKIIHLYSSQYFFSGGSTAGLLGLRTFSKKAFIIDIETGIVEQLSDMF